MLDQLKNLAGNESDFALLAATGAVQTGHFKLASGRHSPLYFQCARAFVDTTLGTQLGAKLADRVRRDIGNDIDICIAPAIGGIVVGYEVARQFGCQSIFFERKDGDFTLRRGFQFPQGARTLVVEDVVTTGGSLQTCIDLARAHGAHVVGACSLLQRIGVETVFDVPYTRLIAIEAPSYDAQDLPASLAALPITIPGSSARLDA